MGIGFFIVGRHNQHRREVRKEKLNVRIFLLPLLQAEYDRRVLKSLKKADEEEAAIMKDVPGWVVGEKVYHTEAWVPPLPAQLKDF